MTNCSFKRKFRERNTRHHLLKPDEPWNIERLIDMVDDVMTEVAANHDQTQRIAKVAYKVMFDVLGTTDPGKISKLMSP